RERADPGNEPEGHQQQREQHGDADPRARRDGEESPRLPIPVERATGRDTARPIEQTARARRHDLVVHRRLRRGVWIHETIRTPACSSAPCSAATCSWPVVSTTHITRTSDRSGPENARSCTISLIEAPVEAITCARRARPPGRSLIDTVKRVRRPSATS